MNSIKWVTIINSGYIAYALNFLRAIDFDFDITIYCLDEGSMTALRGQPHCTCVDASVFMKKKYSQRLCIWATTEYKQMMSAKLDAILYSLEQYSCPIGYLDLDIILFSDPSAIMLKCMEENPEAQLFHQCDEIIPECTDFHNCKALCGGVMVFRNNDICKGLLSHTESEITRYNSNDQEFITHNCNIKGIKRVSVSKNIFLNGAYPYLKQHKIKFPDTACLVHFNHIVDRNGEKQKAMALQNLWYL